MMNFHAYTEAMSCKGLETLGFALRISKKFKLAASFKAIYYSLVRSLLEYVFVLWDPCTAVDYFPIERVQRRFLNSSSFTLNIDHPHRDYQLVMHKLGLEYLADRRVKVNLLFLGNLIDGRNDDPSLLSEVNFKVPSRPNRFSVPFNIDTHSTN